MGKITLGEVAIECKTTWKSDKVGVPIVGLEHLEPGEITLSNWEIDSENTFTKKFSKGQVLLGRRRVYLRKAVMAPVDGICSGDITVIEAIPEKILPELLPFVIQNDRFFDYAVQGSAGSLSPRVKWEHLKKYSFELPPIDEQKVLANKLWAAYRLKDSYKKLLFATDEMVKSQFIEMFGDLDTNVKSYPITTVDKVSMNLFAGGDKPNDISGALTDKYTYPVWANGEGERGLLGYSKTYRVDKEALTISARGTIGYSAIREPYFTPVVRLITLIPNEKVDIVYLKHFFDQTGFESTGAVQGQLTIPTIKVKKVLVPPIEEQKKFSWIVKQADKSKFTSLKSQFIEMFGDTPERVELSSLCETFIDGDWIEAKDQAEDGIRLIQTGNVGVGVFKDKGDKARYISEDTFERLNCTEVKNGDILVSRLPDPVGRACIIPEGLGKTITAVDCTIIRLADKIVPKFFIAFTNTPDYAMQIKKVLSGTTRLRVSRANLGKIQVPLPAIQKQIEFVSIAEQADKSKFTSLKSQFIEMFYGMETTPVKDYIDDSFPGEWGTEDKDGNGVKVIRTTNFTNSGKLNLADVVTRSIEDRKVARKQIKKYDTILERSGGTADNPVGRVVLFEEDDLFLCNNFTQVLRFKEVDPRFAFYALYYFYQTNRTAIRSMGSKTTGIQNLNMSKYLEIGIPNASDEDQKEFVTIAEQADKSKYIN